MSGNIKINPEIAQGTANVFNSKSIELSDIITAIGNQVNASIGSGKPGWEGSQADLFVSSWETEFKPALNKLVTALGDARKLLTDTIAAYQALDGR